MTSSQVQLTESILEEVKGLPARKLREILGFVSFVKAREAIDPEQAYFWSANWQKLESMANRDKKKRRVIGDGSAKGLIRELGS